MRRRNGAIESEKNIHGGLYTKDAKAHFNAYTTLRIGEKE